jgi:hypothetical protein
VDTTQSTPQLIIAGAEYPVTNMTAIAPPAAPTSN